MVRENHMGAVAHKQVAVDLYAHLAQSPDFLEESYGIEHHAVADHAAAAGAKNSAGHQLQNKFLSVDDDGVAGVVSASIAGDNREVLREHVDDLALTFVAPLGADDDRSLPLLHANSVEQNDAAIPGRNAGSHTLVAHNENGRG